MSAIEVSLLRARYRVGSSAAKITKFQNNVRIGQSLSEGKFDFIHQNIGPLGQVKSGFRKCGSLGSGHSTVFSGIGGFLGFYQSVSHVLGLILHGQPLAVSQIGNGESSQSGENYAEDIPPFGRRFVLLWGSAGLLFPCCYFGSKLIDGGRKGLGNTLVVGGFILFGLGLALVRSYRL